MQTKLAAFCDALIEAGWLAALVSVPLYLNALSARVFEPEKLTLLRVIASLVVLAWAVRSLEGLQPAGRAGSTPPEDAKPGWRNWLLLPAGALVACFVLSSVLSVAPGISFAGGYQRLQGTLTLLAYVVIALAIAANLRTRAQLDRLITAAIVISVPISLYGLMQQAQRDPMPWTADVVFRVSSTMGNAIFIAAYLIMVIPVTLMRLIQAVGDLREPASRRSEAAPILIAVAAGLLQVILLLSLILRFGTNQGVWWVALPVVGAAVVLCLPFFTPMTSRPARLLQVTGYGFALAVQVLATIFSQSRGPWLGLLVGLVVVGLALGLRSLGRRGMVAVVAATVLAGAFVITMNIPGGPLEPLRSVPYLGRLGQLAETEGTGKVRLLIWRSTWELFVKHPAPGLEPDPLNALRPLIGFGPETLFFTFNKVYPPELANLELRTASPDRAHNETLQNLVEIGLLGALVFWLVFNYITFQLLDAAGLVAPAHRRWARVLVLVLGLPALVGYLLFAGVAGVQPARIDRAVALTAIGLLGAIVAHVVEIQFGIAIAATRLYFFAYAGAAVPLLAWRYAEATQAVGAPASEAAAPAEATPEAAEAPAPVPVRALTPAVALAGATVRPGSGSAPAAGGRGRGGRRRPDGSGGGGSGPADGGAGPVPRHELRRSRGGGGSSASRLWLPGIYVGLTTLMALAGSGLSPLLDPRPTLTFGFLWFLLGIACLAVALMGPSVSRFWQPSNALYIVPMLLVAAGLFVVTIAPVQADVFYKRGTSYAGGAGFDGLPDLVSAVSLAPSEDFYYLAMGRAFLDLAKNAQDAKRADLNVTITPQMLTSLRPEQMARFGPNDSVRAAEAALQTAQRVAPLNTDHYANLGRLYRFWVELGNGAKRDDMLAWYNRAVQMNPQSALLRDELAQAYGSAKLFDQALAAIAETQAIDPRYENAYRTTVDIYAAQGKTEAMFDAFARLVRERPTALNDPRAQRWLETLINAGYTDRLIALYREAIAALPRPQTALLQQQLGFVETRAGNTDAALAAFEEAAQLRPDDFISLRNLASLYYERGRLDEAIRMLRQAIQVAPADRKAELQSLLSQVEAQRGSR